MIKKFLIFAIIMTGAVAPMLCPISTFADEMITLTAPPLGGAAEPTPVGDAPGPNKIEDFVGWAVGGQAPNNSDIVPPTDATRRLPQGGSNNSPNTNAPSVPQTCAQRAFAGAMAATSNTVTESDPETAIRAWVYRAFGSADALRAVLNCPDPSCENVGAQHVAPATDTKEGANMRPYDSDTACQKISEMDDDEIINFPPVGYTFAGGRQIIVNYMTQPKILKQRLIVDGKRAMPGVCAPAEKSNYAEPYAADSGGDCASGRVGPDSAGNIWVNTEPAWYGIMVVQAGALDKYVGDGANNTISLKYIEDHLDDFYPHNYNAGGGIMALGGIITIPMCTTQSSFADDGDIVNIAAHKTTGDDGGTFSGNDFYVAGDRDLRWIGWAEVAADVAITVVTFGGGTAVSALTKSIRAARAVDTSLKTINDLRKLDKVLEFEKVGQNIAKSEKLLNAVKSPEKIGKSIGELEKSISGLDKVKDADEIANLTKRADELRKLQADARGMDAKRLEGELKTLGDSKTELGKNADVQKYDEQMKNVENLQKWQADLKALKTPQRGNVLARGVKKTVAALKSARAVMGGGKTIGAAEKVARAGMKAGKIRDWLFVNSLKFAGMTARAVANAGLLYGAISVVKNMYDMTQTSTGDYTSTIEFKPLLLLSADNLEGQENVVNHGMWFMFAGDSVNPSDDDAAYLQAMDFAAKFAEDMNDTQDGLIGNNGARAQRANLNQSSFQDALDTKRQAANAAQTPSDANQTTTPSPSAKATGDTPPREGNSQNADHPANTTPMDTAAMQKKFGVNNTARMMRAALNPAYALQFMRKSGTPAGFCDVDIYVVRPIIKNPTPDGGGELYYLIMNDQPWRVRQ